MDIEIKRSGSRPSTKASAKWFAVDPLIQAPDSARVSGGHGTSELGACTAKLAWCRPDDANEPYRDSRVTKRKARDLDGEGEQPAIPAATPRGVRE